MTTPNRPLWLRALLFLAAFLLATGWILFAVAFWGGGRISWGGTILWPKTGYLPLLRTIPYGVFLADLPERFESPMGRASACIYLCLTPFPCWAFTLTALLPEGLRTLFPDKKRLRTLYWAVAAILLLFGLLCALAGCTGLLHRLPYRIQKALVRLHLLLIPISAGLAVLGWLLPRAVYRLVHRRETARDVTGGLRRLGLSAACAFAVAAASCLLLAAITPLAPQAVNFVKGFCGQNAVYDSLFFVSVFMAPLMEELAFRGLIQRGLRKAVPAWAAIGLTAVYFGLWHRNTGQFVYTFLFALVTGAVYEVTGKLRYPWLIHTLNNLIAILAYSDSPRALLGQLHIFPWLRKLLLGLPVWAAVLLLLLCVAGIALMVRQMRQRPGKTALR